MADINDLTRVHWSEEKKHFVLVQSRPGQPNNDTIKLTADEIADLYRITRPADKHRLTTGLVRILLNIHKTVQVKGRNDIHVNREVPEVCGPQAYHQLSNTTKLRFHGLIAKVKDKDGNHVKGHWLITKRGGEFLRGEIDLPEFAHTQKNKVIDHSGNLVSMARLKLQPVEFEHREDIQHAPAPIVEESGQARFI